MWKRPETNRTVVLLSGLPAFASCSRAELEKIGMFADEVMVPSGFPLMRAGDQPLDCLLIVEGEARVEASAGTEVVGPGALLGAASLAGLQPRAANVITQVPTRIFAFSYRGLRALQSCAVLTGWLQSPTGPDECLVPPVRTEAATSAAQAPRPVRSRRLAVPTR